MQTILTTTQLPWEQALTITRIERDRMVIFDPRCAPLLRPLLREADLHPWHTPTGAHWIIVAPATGLPPNLLRHLEAVAPLDAPTGWWAWEPPALPTPRIILHVASDPVVTWDVSSAVLSAPALAGATAFQLALLGARPGLERLSATDPAALLERLDGIAAPEPTREHLAALALQRVEWARTQQQADTEYARRLLADFGPPGAHLSPRLIRWWELSVGQLFTALEADLHNGVPTEFQPFYAQRHIEALAARERLQQRIADLEATLDAQATALWEA